MTFLIWAFRFIIFFVLLAFALRNTQPVSLQLILDHVWEAPLVIVLLVFFACGAALGILSVVGIIFRQRREISRLKRDTVKPQQPIMPEPSVPI